MQSAYQPVALRPAIKWFAERMELKLRKYDNEKTGWENEAAMTLLEQCFDEWRELSEALTSHRHTGNGHQAVIDEAADVANFAMMVACLMDNAARCLQRGK